MLFPWELAAASMRCLRDLAAAADRAADGVVQAGGLLASLVSSLIRVFRELAAAAMRCLRDLAAAADRAADGVVQAAGLLASLVYSLIRVFRALLIIARTVATGYRRIAELLVEIGVTLAEFRSIFSPDSRRHYTHEYRREARQQRRAERELRRRESARAREAAVQAREERRWAQPPSPPQPARGRDRRGEDSDGYSPSGYSPDSSGSSGSSRWTFFSARSN